MTTETIPTNESSITLDPSFKFPSLAEAMVAFVAARRACDEKQVLYGIAAQNNAEKVRLLNETTKAREEADMQYALAQVSRRRIDELLPEESQAVSRRDKVLEQLAPRGAESAQVQIDPGQFRSLFKAADSELQRITTERLDEIKRVCLMAAMTEAEITRPDVWVVALLAEALSRLGAKRNQAARTVGIAKSEQQAANEALSAAAAAAIASTDVFRIRSKQLAATALDESIPLAPAGAECGEDETAA